MSLDSDVIVDRRRIRRKLTFWRVAAGPLRVAIAPTVTIAAIVTRPATNRQKVSLRRILRRSTITSESSDIEISPEIVGAFCTRSASEALPDYINCGAI